QFAGRIVLQVGAAFVLEFVAGTAGARALRAAALDHEIGNHAMEIQAVVEPALREVDEIGDRHRRLVVEQADVDRAPGSLEGCSEAHGSYLPGKRSSLPA